MEVMSFYDSGYFNYIVGFSLIFLVTTIGGLVAYFKKIEGTFFLVSSVFLISGFGLSMFVNSAFSEISMNQYSYLTKRAKLETPNEFKAHIKSYFSDEEVLGWEYSVLISLSNDVYEDSVRFDVKKDLKSVISEDGNKWKIIEEAKGLFK